MYVINSCGSFLQSFLPENFREIPEIREILRKLSENSVCFFSLKPNNTAQKSTFLFL